MSAADKVISLIADQTLRKPEAITREHRLVDDLDFDSLDTVEVVIFIEEELGIEIADADLEGIETVADLIAKVDALLAQKGSAE